MKLLLDAHLSPKGLGALLKRAGHDVLCLADRPELDGLSDAQVLELAAEQGRILVTCNGRDFVPLLREWGESQLPHPGCVLLWSFHHDEYGSILRALKRCFAERPQPSDWTALPLTL